MKHGSLGVCVRVGVQVKKQRDSADTTWWALRSKVKGQGMSGELLC